jgi:hypothetical protein
MDFIIDIFYHLGLAKADAFFATPKSKVSLKFCMKRAKLTNHKELIKFFSKMVTLFVNFGINFGKLRCLDFLTGDLIFFVVNPSGTDATRLTRIMGHRLI